MRPDQACDDFVRAHYSSLFRAAFLLTGHRAAAEDLTQDAVVRLIQKWPRIVRAEHPPAYARRLLLHLFLSGRRRRWTTEIPLAELPDSTQPSESARVEDWDWLRRALLALPPRQRAALVLRYYEDASETDTAKILGCSVGTVKSLASRGLAALRAHDAASEPAD